MLRDQLKDFSSWMVCLGPEAEIMFGSKTSGGSTFYTDLHITDDKQRDSQQFFPIDNNEKTEEKNRNSHLLEQQSATSEDGNSQDSDSIGGVEEQSQYPRHSFHKIASFGGYPRFRPFVMSMNSTNSAEEIAREESSYSQVPHNVIEYRTSRFVNKIFNH